MTNLLELIRTHEAVSFWLAAFSLVIFLVGLVLLPWLVVRIPEDYFVGRRRSRQYRIGSDSLLAWLLLVIKNLAGGVLVLLGIAMLVLPGQGLLAIVLGIALMNFPGKYRLERWLVSRGSTLKLINYLRRRRGKPVLVLDEGAQASWKE
jgi:hypothetical protein